MMPRTAVRWRGRLAFVALALTTVTMVGPSEAQQTVAGRVLDAQSLQPLSGVQVGIPSLAVGTLTRANGRFILLNVPAGTHRLVAERIGYSGGAEDITVGSQPVQVNFELSQRAIALDEVVITGTAGGTQRRAVGNVVSRLDMTDLVENTPAPRLDQAIGNRIAGVRMQGQPTQAGGPSQIRIRGTSSIGLAADPLIYVDGIRLEAGNEFRSSHGGISRLADIDPNSIQSIEIIKGPAAATLYGTEAANGVIQITTRRGTVGEPVFDASVEVGASWMTNPAGRIGDHYWRDRATGEVHSHNLYILEQQPDRFGKPLFQNGPIQRYNLAVAGGTEFIRYNAGFNRSDVEGVSRWDWDVRNRANVALTMVPRKNLTFNVNASRVSGKTREAFAYMCRVDCFARPETVNKRPQRGYQSAPWEAWIEGTDRHFSSQRTSWSLEASHQPTSWYTHRLVGGIDDATLTRDLFTPRGARGHGEVMGRAGRIGQRSLTIIGTPTRTLDYAGTLTLPVGSSIQSATSFGLQYYNRVRTSHSLSGRDYAVPVLSVISAAADRNAGQSQLENTSVGTYIQNVFDFSDRAFLTVGVRADDNSAFGEEFSAAIYPKVSATWVLSEEGFWRPGMLGLNELRLRGAWGAAGMQPDIFASETLYAPSAGPDLAPVIIHSSLGNPDLGPESSSEFEGGFDASFLNGRLEAEFTGYHRVTSDALVPGPVRPSVGFPGTLWQNVGEVRAWGTETQMSAQLLTQDPVRWNLNLAFTTMANRITELPLQRILTRGTHIMWHVEGFPVGGIHARSVVSADFVKGNSGPVKNVMCDGGIPHGSGFKKGGAPVPCAEAPDVFLGHGEPKWLVNLGSSFTILRNLNLTASFDAMGGHHLTHPYASAKNIRSSRAYVMQDDPIFMGQAQYSPHEATTIPSGFLKLRELTLRYSLPDAVTQRFGASRASITGSAYNVATLWQEVSRFPSGGPMWDIEVHGPNVDVAGESHGPGPPLNSATIRMNVTF